ncbi:SLC13 family permease [Paenibacillus yanchengensis]|uniref:SLC13 family permease n=1 Tax=Paenibacillus yanchengensis TaxID=2035833 RepID=A0ABW4YPS9_9BACL
MTTDMIITIVILIVAAILFVSGKIRADLVAVCALILLVSFGILRPDEALSGFSNSVVIMMIGLFVVGGGIFHTGLAKKVSGYLLKFSGNSETKLLITVILVTAFIGAFVSNTGTVAVMLPIVVSLAMSADIHPGKLLMPLAFASSLGGTLTLIGTPPNMVIRETLANAGITKLSFFSFTPIGIACLIIGFVLILFFSRYLVPANKNKDTKENNKGRARSLKELATQYSLSQNLYRVQVKENAPIIHKQLHELKMTDHYSISISEIRRVTSSKNPFFKTISQEVAGPNTYIESNDILYVNGSYENVERFAHDNGVTILDRQTQERLNNQVSDHYASAEIGIAEVLFPPNSKHISRLIKQTGFREKFQINILGVNRKGNYILHQLKDEKLRFGDALLVQGTWENIARLAEEQDDVVVVGQPLEAAKSVPNNAKAPIAGAIMVLMVVMMILDILPAVISVLIAAVLMVVTGCLRSMEEAYKTVNWESIVLIGGMIPMSIAIENTGVAALMSTQLVNTLGSYGPLALLAGIYFSVSFLNLFISNTATAVLFAPIALSAAIQMGVNPITFLFAVSLAATICFAVPFSTPPNALVMTAGRYSFMDFVRVGLPIQLLLGVAMVALLPLFFPF